MNIIVGSLNQTKMNAVQAVFQDFQVVPKDVASGVSVQPIGDEETRKGAINRAVNAHKSDEKGFAIGLEGGVMEVEEVLFLCNWGALVDPAGNLYTAAGARIELPKKFKEPLMAGKELSELMDAYVQKENIRNHEGAIGIFTNNLIDRSTMFTHVVTLLKGQMEYWNR